MELLVERLKEDYFQIVQEILGIDSPSGYTFRVMKRIARYAEEAGFAFEQTRKGSGMITIPGKDTGKTIALTAHVDTLGAMVRSASAEGELSFTRVGGPLLPTLDGEYCTVCTREEKRYTGTFLSKSPAVHVHPDSADRPRNEENMYIRLDEQVHNKEEVAALGISAGDYVFIDPKTVVTPSGFLKSRFIDDKASAACLLAVMRLLSAQKLRPACNVTLFFSVYEEVGHGGAWMPQGLEEILAVDMGCIGLDLGCDEYKVSICAKDSHGPYDYELTTRLINLAKQASLSYAVDIYPRYGSDVGAAWSAGNDIKGALIGPGVHASHGMERTHWQGIENTIRLLLLYLGVY